MCLDLPTLTLLHVSVLLVQLFQKFPLRIAVAPTRQSPAFAATQLLVLGVFVTLGRAAWRGFQPAPA